MKLKEMIAALQGTGTVESDPIYKKTVREYNKNKLIKKFKKKKKKKVRKASKYDEIKRFS
jgi:hypothetical protein